MNQPKVVRRSVPRGSTVLTEEQLEERQRQRAERQQKSEDERRQRREARIRTKPEKVVAKIPCQFRGEKVAQLTCNCRNKPVVFDCSAWPVGKCILEPIEAVSDAPLSTDPAGERYWPWTSEEGDTLGELAPWGRVDGPCRRIPACSLCQRRQEPIKPPVLEILNPESPICIVTAYTPDDIIWKEMGELTSATMRDYCKRHGYGFMCHTGDFEEDIHPSWSKIKFLKQALETHDTVLWLDADAFVTNPYQRIEDLHNGPEELCLCSDSADLNCGAILLRKSPFATWLLNTIWLDRFSKNRLWEQDTVNRMIVHGDLSGHFRQYPPRVFNARLPAKKDKWIDWRHGDFIAHAYHTGGVAARKIEHIREALEKAESAIDLGKIEESKRFMESIPKYPFDRFTGRGIVTSAGGAGLQLNAYVMVRLLRELGCKLPVECWYDGVAERDEAFQVLMKPLGVECIDARERGFAYIKPKEPIIWEGSQFQQKCSPQLALGTVLKSYSYLCSSFEEPLWLDADCFSIYDPTMLYDTDGYKATGSMLWPDILLGCEPNLSSFGVCKYMGQGAGFETGIMVFDKRRTWQALNMWVWYNYNADWTYRWSWTDKDTIFAAMLLTNTTINLQQHAYNDSLLFAQYGPDGNPMFCHRVTQGSKLQLGKENRWPDWFPHEAKCTEYMADYKKAMA